MDKLNWPRLNWITQTCAPSERHSCSTVKHVFCGHVREFGNWPFGKDSVKILCGRGEMPVLSFKQTISKDNSFCCLITLRWNEKKISNLVQIRKPDIQEGASRSYKIWVRHNTKFTKDTKVKFGIEVDQKRRCRRMTPLNCQTLNIQFVV